MIKMSKRPVPNWNFTHQFDSADLNSERLKLDNSFEFD